MERAALTREQFVELWTNAATVEDMSRQTGLPTHAIYKFVRRYGLPARSHGRKRPVTVDVPQLFRLWHSGMQIRLMAEALGVTECQVGKLAARYKLPPRGLAQGTDVSKRADDPTPEQIAERAAECRARRPAREDDEAGVELRAFAYSDRTGLFRPMDAWAV